MKSNHLLLLALKKVREHVGEGRTPSAFLLPNWDCFTFHSGNSRRNSFYPDGRTAPSADRGASGVFRAGTLRLRINLREVEFGR